MRRTALAAVLALVLSMMAMAAPAGAQGGDVSDYLGRINGLRSSLGLAPLQLDGNLSSLAAGWAQHMADQGSISHAPDLSAGVTSNWTKLGENVGVGPNTAAIMQAFINSPAHYANLTDPAFTHIGIGVVYSGGRQWVVHRFMAVAGSAPAPSPPATGSSSSNASSGSSVPVVPATSAPAPTTTTTTAPPPPPEPVVTPPPAVPARVAAMLDALHDAGD